MQIREIMTPDVEVVSPDSALLEAAQKMKHLDVGAIPVCDGERLVGMLTDRDITTRATAEKKDPTTTKVGDVMTPEVVYAFEDDEVESAGGLMRDRQIRRLPILNREKRLVGIISLGDLAVDSEDDAMSGDVLEGVSEPSAPAR